MDERLYINGILIQLEPRSVSRSLQINDFRDVKDRQSNYSNSIKIPRNANNVEAFGTLGFTGSTSRLPYENVSVKYVLNGIEMITGGKGVIKNTDDFFNLVIYDGNISMSDLLGTLTLADLDFSAYNHNLSLFEFLNSQSNTYNDGYIYGVAGDTSITVSNVIPNFYIGKLFEEIFTQKGWSVTGAIFSDANYQSRVMTMDIGFNQTLTVDETNVYSQFHNTNRSGNSIGFVFFTLDSYTITADGVYTIELNGSVTQTSGDYALFIAKNGINILTADLNTKYFEEFEDGDIVTVILSVMGTPYNITENFTTEIDLNNSYYSINFEDIIGTTKQIDFVKDVMQRFNLTFRKVRNDNQLEFVTAETLLTGFSSAEDWSDKFSKKLNESYTSNYARDNEFKYRYDESDEDYANGNLLINDLNLKTQATLVTSIFKASKTVNNVYQMNYWNADNEPNQNGIRIFKLTQNTQQLQVRLNSDFNFDGVTKTYNFLDFSSLDYDQEIADFYGEFNNLLNNYKIVTIEARLNIMDIYNLDFFKLKYIKQLGAYFYLNRVMNFRNNKLTKVELIKIPI